MTNPTHTAGLWLRSIFTCAMLLTFALTGVCADWPKSGTLEIVVPSGPSGGLDLAAREIKNLLDTGKLISTPSMVVNKSGAGGVIAYQYVRQRRGDARVLVLASPALMTNRLMGIGDVSPQELTPVCSMFAEAVVFMVRADSNIRNGKDLVARLKADPASVPWGIATSYGGSNHIAVAAMMKSAQIELKNGLYAIYRSGGDALVALLGGQVEVVPVAASATLSALASGRVRLIAISSAERMGGPLAGVPTWREQGFDAVYTPWRVIYAPGNVSESDVRAIAKTFEKLDATPQWAQAVSKNQWIRNYMDTEATRRFLDQQWAEHRILIDEFGLLK